MEMSIPFLVPALLTSIPAALCLTWIYRSRRRPPHRPELVHLHSLRSSLMRKKAKKRMRLAEGAGEGEGEGGLEESRSLLTSANNERLRREERADVDDDDSGQSEDDGEDGQESSEYSSADEGGDYADSEPGNLEGERAVEIEFDGLLADIGEQLRAEQSSEAAHSAQQLQPDSPAPLPDARPLTPSTSSLSSASSSSSSRSRHRKQQRRVSPLPSLPRHLESASPRNTIIPSIRSGKHRSIYGILYLNVLEAALPSSTSPASCFAVVSHGTQVYRTVSSGRSSTPMWNQKVRLVIREREVNWPVCVSLWLKRGRRRGGGVYCCGRCQMNVREMMGDAAAAASDGPAAAAAAAGADRRRKRGRAEGDDSGAEYTVRNYWQTLSISPALPLQPALAASISAASADPLEPAAALSSSYPLLPRASSYSSLSCRLHLESLFLPVPSSAIGSRMWSEVCALYDLHDEGRVDTAHVLQLLACIGGMRDEDREGVTRACAAGSMSVEQLSEMLSRCELEREREVKLLRKRALKRASGDESIAMTELSTPASTPPSSSSSASSSSASLSSFLVEVPLSPAAALLPQTTALTPVYLSKCPVCLLDLTPSSSLDPRDCLIHVRFCLETLQSLSPELPQQSAASSSSSAEFAMGGFISEEYAVKNWASSMMTGEHYGSDKLLSYLSSRAHFILVQDRSTGQLRAEKVPFLVKLLFRFIYQSALGRSAHSSLSIGLMARMTEMMGRKYDSESSRGHIAAFVHYYAIDMADFDRPLADYRTFNEFFFRKLRPGRRPIAAPEDDGVLVSPADCRITVFQSVSEATRIWVKGKTFSLSSLLVDAELVAQWPDCSLAIARLAPDDYHRFHLPLGCTVGRSRTYSGGYHSVNPLAIRSAKDVLTQNKRVLTALHQTVVDDVLYIAVGATMVGSVVITSSEGERKRKGDEHGYFAFGGSTVLLLFRQGSVRFDEDLLYNTSKSMETLIRMGESIATAAPQSAKAGRAAAAGGRPVPGELGVTRSTINPLSQRKLAENEAVINAERRAARGDEGEEAEAEDADLFTVSDLTAEEVKEVQQLVMTAGDM